MDGWMASRTRADSTGGEPSARRGAAPSGHARWVYFITEQVYEANPSLGPQCGGLMKVIAVIELPAVVRHILNHLGVPTAAPSFRAPPEPPEGLLADPLHAWSSEPLLNDLPAADPVLA